MPHEHPSLHRDIVVIGASAGGLQAISEVLRALPVDFPAAIFIVVHTSPDNPGVLPQILRRACKLTVEFAHDCEPIAPGRVYVAPPDHHLIVQRGHVRVTRGPKENGFRPAVDPLFRSAAISHGARVIGVVCSGGLNDGTLGLAQIVEAGGVAVAQDPQDALIASMPLSAIQNVEVLHVLAAVDMPRALLRLVHEPITPRALNPDVRDPDPRDPDPRDPGESPQLHDHTPPGTPAPYTCPECGGALWEPHGDGKLLGFRCHVGHAFTAEVLAAKQEHNLDIVLWSALRALEENAALGHRMAERSERSGFPELARRYRRDAAHGQRRAQLLRDLLQRSDDPPSPEPVAAPPPAVGDEES